jgi:hypothetical protein
MCVLCVIITLAVTGLWRCRLGSANVGVGDFGRGSEALPLRIRFAVRNPVEFAESSLAWVWPNSGIFHVSINVQKAIPTPDGTPIGHRYFYGRWFDTELRRNQPISRCPSTLRIVGGWWKVGRNLRQKIVGVFGKYELVEIDKPEPRRSSADVANAGPYISESVFEGGRWIWQFNPCNYYLNPGSLNIYQRLRVTLGGFGGSLGSLKLLPQQSESDESANDPDYRSQKISPIQSSLLWLFGLCCCGIFYWLCYRAPDAVSGVGFVARFLVALPALYVTIVLLDAAMFGWRGWSGLPY